ncbi:isoquinoline 1-oxidoreductase subunit beta [Variibacter gotjawalensis]|uniref:Isoquinoline 1-oxidoreductase subunit beta n=1 Tax=Variibacter gotjawalensis TaxID=1333996 RepID=A0A0S3PW85_9BRAD|nr:molybdopterin cofactor-binding domain-containing protein [Variibacter gotjawalensis]NIK46031.1 isoquinoline 1-oxidoreductase beta subunit [Variibacter gotjawalensis]RZS47949.1 isoquinoline 1-oxidoreductase beta subunit [Variibacter gotjawalensis]BAT60205.1 isoquinoline 1-oxidoreductase subunit beta [Variibacter gotjawalensis]
MNIQFDPSAKTSIRNISRRSILKGLFGTSAFVLAAQFPLARRGFAYPTGAEKMPNGVKTDPKLFVAIDKDGTVTIMAARAEMGTGAARTSLPMILADELEADWSRVKIVQANGDETKWGNQDTDGSRSVRHWIQPMRECGATARRMLEQAAAKRWNVAVADVEAVNHEVVHKASGRKLGYGELATDAAALPTPTDFKLKDAAAFRYIGKGNTPVVDLVDITTGHAIYGQDAMLPGMKFAVVARPPVVGGKVASVDASAALKIPGVEKVVQIPATPLPAKFNPLGGVAVIATNTWAAMKGREALKITWDDGPNGSYDSKAYKASLEANVRKPGKVERNEGDIDKAFAGAAKTFAQEYYVPHWAHAPMEPPAALARMGGGKFEIWAPVQSPGGARDDTAKFLGVKPEDVLMHTTLLGGGFGRKSKCDFAMEAAFLSKELGGTPVKVVWTREDDIQHSFYHTVNVDRIEAALDANNKVVGWRQRSASPSILSTFAPDPKHPFAIELGLGFVDMPFAVPNIRLESGEAAAHTRIGWFRAVNNVPHAFAVQSFVAELAHELKRDPKDMLLELIGPDRKVDVSKSVTTEWWNYGEPFETFPVDTARLKNVVQLVAEKAGWGRQMPKGSALGIAAHRSFVSYIATVVEVKIDDKGNITVPRVDTAIDCGFAVNPERIKSQIEGASVMGMTIAKYSEVTFAKGRVEQTNYNDFPIVRMEDSPQLTNVHIVPHGIDTPPSGVGEPGVPPFAPALCNAIFAATGKRIRSLPIGNQLA